VQEPYDFSASRIALIGVVGALVVFVMIVGVQVLFYNLQEIETYKKDISQTPEEISNLVARQQAQLHSYRWIDPKRKIAGIAIDRAMQLVVDDLAKGRSPLRTFAPTTTTQATQPAATRATTQTKGQGHAKK
jgi:hypothetical protein